MKRSHYARAYDHEGGLRLPVQLILAICFAIWLLLSCLDYHDERKEACGRQNLDWDNWSGECYDKQPGDQNGKTTKN